MDKGMQIAITRLYEKVNELEKQSKFEEAISHCDQFIVNYPGVPQGYSCRAGIHSSLQNWTESIADLSQAIDISPTRPGPYFTRARIRVRLRQFELARIDLDRVISLESRQPKRPYTSSAYIFRAIASHYLEDYEAVLSDCAQVPDDFSIYVGSGRRESKEELVNGARRELKRGHSG